LRKGVVAGCPTRRTGRDAGSALHEVGQYRRAVIDVATAAETRRIAEEARDRVRFEEEALELSDQVYRVARRLALAIDVDVELSGDPEG